MYITRKVKKNNMEWYKCSDKEGLPKIEDHKDVHLLIKPDNIPFMYLSVVWDGINLWCYSRHPEFPWTTLDNVHFKEWTYIE